MNLRVIFTTCIIAAFGSSMMPFDALGQKQSLKEQLVGTWMLLSWEQKKADGSKVERYGTSPTGMAIFDAGGKYIITVMQSDRSKYASNALWQATPEENKETADGTITYFGTYSLREAESSIAIHVERQFLSKLEWHGPEALFHHCWRPADIDRSSTGWRRSGRGLEASKLIGLSACGPLTGPPRRTGHLRFRRQTDLLSFARLIGFTGHAPSSPFPFARTPCGLRCGSGRGSRA
ncbi:lipocalin-like domain-containing protein [Bradyrhizobium sp. LLZ17]|uniref:Lipocalin-like domain-containing protein n=1 Tax=Bradyrhizobium sp. LLZ17 TaxID=3239388 RepID=A0AB39XCW2_9BRAD